jgi:PP-loop superfamily ATP-utilizing enzyme
LWASGFNMGFLDGLFFNSDSILCAFSGGIDPLLVSAMNCY